MPLATQQTGPARRRLSALLEAEFGPGFVLSISERSPVGPHAIQIQPDFTQNDRTAGGLDDVRSYLSAQRWVRAAVQRADRIYTQLDAQTLLYWILNEGCPFEDALRQEGDSNSKCTRSDILTKSLSACRLLIVRRALTYLLRAHQLRATISSASAIREEDGGELSIVFLTESPVLSTKEPDKVSIRVGGVDVPKGTLRARYGGDVSAYDLLREIERRLERKESEAARAGWLYGPLVSTIAPIALSYAMLREPCGSRVCADEARLQDAALVACSVITAGAVMADGPSASDVDAIYNLAMEMELLPTASARAASRLEPFILIRQLRSLARSAHVASSSLGTVHPIRRIIRSTIAMSLDSLGLTADPYVAGAQDECTA